MKVVDFARARRPRRSPARCSARPSATPAAVEIGHRDGQRFGLAVLKQPARATPGGSRAHPRREVGVRGDRRRRRHHRRHRRAIWPRPRAAPSTWWTPAPAARASSPEGPGGLASRQGVLKREVFERLKAEGQRATPALVGEAPHRPGAGAGAARRSVKSIEAAGGKAHYHSARRARRQGDRRGDDGIREAAVRQARRHPARRRPRAQPLAGHQAGRGVRPRLRA